MQQITSRQPDFKKEGIKTLGELLQDIVEAEDNWNSLIEFLVYGTEEDRKRIQEKLVDENSKQFHEYMDWFTFVNQEEVLMACQDYFEATMNRAISMWEMWDLTEEAYDYIHTRGLVFDDQE